MIIGAVLISGMMFAQKEPKLEVVGNLVKATYYHDNGQIQQEGFFKDGKLEGKRPFVASDKPVSKIPKSERGGLVGQVDANVGFKEWFAKQDSSFQKEWLGDTKFSLYRDGGYSIDKFVDHLGKGYTLKELQELDQEIFKKLGLNR